MFVYISSWVYDKTEKEGRQDTSDNTTHNDKEYGY